MPKPTASATRTPHSGTSHAVVRMAPRPSIRLRVRSQSSDTPKYGQCNSWIEHGLREPVTRDKATDDDCDSQYRYPTLKSRWEWLSLDTGGLRTGHIKPAPRRSETCARAGEADLASIVNGVETSSQRATRALCDSLREEQKCRVAHVCHA